MGVEGFPPAEPLHIATATAAFSLGDKFSAMPTKPILSVPGCGASLPHRYTLLLQLTLEFPVLDQRFRVTRSFPSPVSFTSPVLLVTVMTVSVTDWIVFVG